MITVPLSDATVNAASSTALDPEFTVPSAPIVCTNKTLSVAVLAAFAGLITAALPEAPFIATESFMSNISQLAIKS
jgi:ABC-type glucose/galactose transport system permease subunit